MRFLLLGALIIHALTFQIIILSLDNSVFQIRQAVATWLVNLQQLSTFRSVLNRN